MEMMKAGLVVVLFAVGALNGGRLGAEEPPSDFNLREFNARFDRIQKTGMTILGGWAGANFLGNGMPLLLTSADAMDETLRSFLIMNAGWNVVNAALSGIGLFTCCRTPPSARTLGETVKQQHRMEKIYLFNAGLDVGYMAFGLYLTEKAATAANPHMLRGFGYSLILQGAALFVFDVVMPIIHARNRRALDEYLGTLPRS